MLNNQNIQQILKVQKDLRLIKCQTTHNIELPLHRNCKNVSDLFKVLKMKNNYISKRPTKQRKKVQIQVLQLQDNNYGVFSAKIWQQKQKILDQLQKNKKKEKRNSHFTYDLLKSFQSNEGQSSKIGIYDHLDLLGWNQQRKLCTQYKISNEFNQQSVQDLAQCFRHLANVSQPIKRSQKQQHKQQQISNISQYKQILSEISNRKYQKQGEGINLFQILSQAELNNKSLTKIMKNYQLFDFILNHLKQQTKISPYNSNKIVLVEMEKIFQNMALFIKDQEKQRKFMKEHLNQSEFWQKICYLYSKGYEEYSLLQHHLKYHEQLKLLQHFNNVVAGKQQSFEPKISLLSNPFYRQFIMLLQNKYLNYCTNKELPYNKIIYIALREISMLNQQNKPYQFQLNYLKQVISKIVYQFKTNLILNKPNQIIRKQIIELFTLGQYNIVLNFLYVYNKLQTLQFLLLLSILYGLDVKHSSLLLYDHNQTVLIYTQLLQNIMIYNHSSSMEEIFNLLSAFLPTSSLLNKENQSFISKLLVINKKFFQYITQVVGIIPTLTKLHLNFDIILNILQTSMAKHQNYSYCLQLALSSCFQLQQIPKLSTKFSNNLTKSTSLKDDSLPINEKGHQFERSSLQIWLHISQKPFSKDQRLKLLLKAYEMLTKTNIILLKNPQIRLRKYQQISFINELYMKISQKQQENMCKNLQIYGEEVEKHKQQIKQHLSMVVLTYNMLRLKVSIPERKFQYIVQVLNSLFQSIAQSFTNNISKLESIYNPSLTKDILIIFIADIVQSILLLKQFKPKVIDRNRTILKYVCKVVYQFLISINTKQPSAKILYKQLEQIMSQLNSYGNNTF